MDQATIFSHPRQQVHCCRTYHRPREGKYGLVELQERFGQIMLPEIELVDIKEKYRKKRMSGHFSDRLVKLVEEALAAKKQIILFQNRRGFSPVVECKTCGVSPQCPNCDVSLTFHKFRNELRCHYCGHGRPLPSVCPARMDLDTTRGKYAYQKLLREFQSHEVDILVGTQMLTKGLDFGNVSLVGVLNADNLLNFLIDQPGRVFAEIFVLGQLTAQKRVGLTLLKGHRSQIFTHAPLTDHAPGQLSGFF